MNRCLFTGNLIREPELRTLPSGDRKVVFVLAVQRSYTNRKGEHVSKPIHIHCEAWNSGADYLASHYREGDAIEVDATLDEDEWEKDGKTLRRLKFRALEFRPPPRNPRFERPPERPQGVDQ